MRLPFFFSTVAFCFYASISLFALLRGSRSLVSRMPWGSFGRKRVFERVFICFTGLSAFWALGTALFISAGTAAEALFWFRVFAFTWFLAPGMFVLLVFALSEVKLNAFSTLAPLAPGIAVLLANFIAPTSVVASASPIPGGWHVVYAPTVWSGLNLANTVGMSLFAALALIRTAALSCYERRRRQALVVLAFFVPTFLLSAFTAVVARWLGISDLPPLTPSFFTILVVGLTIAVFRYELLELTPAAAAERVIASVTDAVVLADVGGAIIDSNLPGNSRGAALSNFMAGTESPGDWLNTRARASGEFETEFAFKEGQFAPASVRVRSVKDGSGVLFGYVVAARDLSTEKSLEREAALSSQRADALHSAEEKFTRVFRLCPAGMIIAEISTNIILDANDAVCAIVGKGCEELTGMSLWALGYSMAPDLIEEMRNSMQAGIPIRTRELSLQRENGTTAVLAVAAVPLDFAGKSAALISFVNISELVFLRGELSKAQKMESIGAMAAGLAHDFNNILTAIMGNISLARLSLDGSDEASAALTSAEAACSRARTLSKQLLMFARGGNPSARLLDIFEIVLETTRIAVSGTSVAASFSADPGLPRAMVDREQIETVFSNLALNAVQAMPSGGALRVRGFSRRVGALELGNRAPGTYVCVEFADEGAGIAPEMLPRVFDPYMNSQRKDGGLSLAVCDSIVQRHDGWITAESTLGKGSTFTVYLPVGMEVFPETESAGSPEDRELRMGKGAILVMDDEFAIRMMASRLLTRLGYESTTVPDGEAAVAAFKEARAAGRSFRAVILDLTIPGGMNGVDTASVIRSIDPAVPIYVSSGYGDSPVLRDFSFYGFNGVIPKPYSLEELSSRLAVVR